MHKTGSSVEWFFNPHLGGWTFHFLSSGKKIHISDEFIHDWKYSMGDLVYEIQKIHNITLDEASTLHSVLHTEQKKALLGVAYGQKLSPQLKSLFPKKDLEPRPRVLYLVDLGDGMLVPRSFIQDFLAWEKKNPSQDSWYPDTATYEAMIESVCAPSMTQEEADKLLAKYLIDLVNKYADPTSPSPYPKMDI